MEFLADAIRELRPDVFADQVLRLATEDLACLRADVRVLPKIVKRYERIGDALEDILQLRMRAFEFGYSLTEAIDLGRMLRGTLAHFAPLVRSVGLISGRHRILFLTSCVRGCPWGADSSPGRRCPGSASGAKA